MASPRVHGEVVAGHRLSEVEVPGWSVIPPSLDHEPAIGVCQELVSGVNVGGIPDISLDIYNVYIEYTLTL